MTENHHPKTSKLCLVGITYILCCTITHGASVNLSTFVQDTGWTPPILETQVSILQKILQTASVIKHADTHLFEGTLEETIRSYFVRLNCIADEDSRVDFNLLRDALATMNSINKNNLDTWENLSVFLSLVPGIKNANVYHENLARIKDIANDAKGVISHVLLDLTSVSVGPFDGFSLTQKWASCDEIAFAHGFQCGFIFDFRLCIKKISIFGHIQSRKSIPVFLTLRNDTYDNLLDVYERSELDACIYAVIQGGMKIAGVIDDENKFLLNSTHFEIENGTPNRFTFMSLQAQRISRLSFKNQVSQPECRLETPKLYSDVSRNQSTSAVISISAHDLYKVFSTDVYVRDNGTYHGYSFTELFHRFLVIFPSLSTPDPLYQGNISIPKLLSAVLGYAETNEETYHLRPIQLWIAFTHAGNILDELETVMNYAQEMNSNFPGTVAFVFLHYNELRIDSSVVSVIKRDVEICNSHVKESNISCGYVFLGRNCQRSTSWLTKLPFQEDSLVLIRGRRYDLTKCAPAVRRAQIGMLVYDLSPLLIKIDFQNTLFTIPPLTLQVAQGDTHRYIPIATSSSPADDAISSSAYYSDKWMYSPMTLSRTSIAFVVDVNELSNKNLMDLVTVQDSVVIRLNMVNKRQGQTKNNFQSFCSSESPYQVAILIPYIPYLADNLEILNDLLSDISNANSLCGIVFTEILIEWNPCLGSEPCPSKEDDEYCGSSLFAGLANVTKFMERIRETPFKTGLIISPRTVRFLFLSYFLALKMTAQHIGEEVERLALKVSSLLNVTQVLSMLDQFDTFVYEPEITISEILDMGAVQTATKTIRDLEDVTKLLTNIQPHIFPQKNRGPLVRSKIRVRGCHVLNSTSWKARLEYARFWEILGNWAEKMDANLILDNAYQSVKPTKCMNNSSECACSWWIMDETSGQLLNQKSYPLVMMKNLAKQKPLNTSHWTGHITTLTIVASFSLLVVLIGSISVPLGIHFYRKKYILSRKEARELLSDFTSNVDPDLDMTSSDLLGKGSSKTVVYKCTLKTGNTQQDVAVKVFQSTFGGRLDTENLLSLRGLISEAATLRNLKIHPNVIKYFGLCTAKFRQGELKIILEYCPNGSLQQILPTLRPGSTDVGRVGDIHSTNKGVPLEEIDAVIMKWCLEIAQGLEYLVSENIVHADIATRNILLDQQMSCKICDFGLSRRMEKYNIYVKTGEEPLPWRWMAPESLQKLIFNEKTDVWMYGVTVWEIYTFGQVPYGGLAWTNEFGRLLEGGLRLEIPYKDTLMVAVSEMGRFNLMNEIKSSYLIFQD